MPELPFHAAADAIIAELVPYASRLRAAAVAENDVLFRARQADCDELLAPLCPRHLRALVLFMGAHLADLGWTPDDHPDAADIDPDAALPASPPEVQWKANER